MRKQLMVHVFGGGDRGYGLHNKRAGATPADQSTSSTLALGRFGNTDAINEQLVDDPNGKDDRFKKVWLSI